MLTPKGRNIYLILSGALISFPLYFFLVWNDVVGSHEASIEKQHHYLSEYSFLSYNGVNYTAIVLLIFSLSFILRLISEKNYLKWIGIGLSILNGILFFHYLRLLFTSF
ncbi:hypothetical protein UJ101_02717 [Flavobacteriaceae bacterium UJ101]|nr:hypothetical protein UJ101_02717 [Flavobacteriaceae bacterium UJ101]